jgi:DNA-binding MarR family transcriptional regulator
MKGFFIEVTNNLLEKKHRKAMGTAVWEFMWCLDKITKIDEKHNGFVLGGMPIKLKMVRDELGITEQKISKNLHKLEAAGYLELTTAPYGIIIKVKKAQKRFNQKGKPVEEKRFNLKGKAPNQKGKPRNHKGKPNKTRQITKTDDSTILIAPQDGARVKHPALASFKKGEKMVTPVGEIIDLFKHVNPRYQELFKMKAQHRAVERMIIAHGFEKIEFAAKHLAQSNKVPFAPAITTPYELEKKLPKLVIYYQRKKAESDSSKKTIFL